MTDWGSRNAAKATNFINSVCRPKGTTLTFEWRWVLQNNWTNSQKKQKTKCHWLQQLNVMDNRYWWWPPSAPSSYIDNLWHWCRLLGVFWGHLLLPLDSMSSLLSCGEQSRGERRRGEKNNHKKTQHYWVTATERERAEVGRRAAILALQANTTTSAWVCLSLRRWDVFWSFTQTDDICNQGWKNCQYFLLHQCFFNLQQEKSTLGFYFVRVKNAFSVIWWRVSPWIIWLLSGAAELLWVKYLRAVLK